MQNVQNYSLTAVPKKNVTCLNPERFLVTWGSSVQIFRVIICAIAVGSLRIETCIKR